MKKEKKGLLLIVGVFFSFGVVAEQKIVSPNGNSLVFMQKNKAIILTQMHGVRFILPMES
ncbi:hypothetical protein GGER_19750 [Serratia rubidaea]